MDSNNCNQWCYSPGPREPVLNFKNWSLKIACKDILSTFGLNESVTEFREPVPAKLSCTSGVPAKLSCTTGSNSVTLLKSTAIGNHKSVI